jgi:hypothetical protein
MIRCVSCGDSRIASVLTRLQQAISVQWEGAFSRCRRAHRIVLTIRTFPQAASKPQQVLDQLFSHWDIGRFGVVQSSQRVTHTRSHVTASLIRGCPLFQMRESGLLLGWTTPSPSVARTRTMYSPGFAGAKWYFHTVQT